MSGTNLQHSLMKGVNYPHKHDGGNNVEKYWMSRNYTTTNEQILDTHNLLFLSNNKDNDKELSLKKKMVMSSDLKNYICILSLIAFYYIFHWHLVLCFKCVSYTRFEVRE